MMVPQSLMCCNGVRLNCTGSGKFTHDKGVRLMVMFLVLGICLTVAVIIHIEQANSHHLRLSAMIVSSDKDAASFKEPTDLKDDSLSYGIIFDCGSSGTRVYIYYWPPHSGNNQDLLKIHQVLGADSKPLSKKVSPGLSTYNKNAENSAEYLKPLLEFAADIIPKHKHRRTPLYIMATAGMRLIDSKEAQAILDDITKDIPSWFDFEFRKDYVQVIPGKTEGMYAWISLNYMLNRFSYGKSSDESSTMDGSETMKHSTRSKTVGVVDMGGGSLQIAFEVTNPSEIKDHENVKTFNLGSEDSDSTYQYTVYTSTFLGYGANSAMARYRDRLVTTENSNATVIPDDCQAKDSSYTYSDSDREVKLRGTGDVTSCIKSLKALLDMDKHCKAEPCSIAGKYQPPIPDNSKFYGISEYWYSTYDVLNLNDYYSYSRTVKEAEKYCQTPWKRSMDAHKKKLYPHADMDRMKDECFKVSWIIEALHAGLNFPPDYASFRPVNVIEGQEVQWSLGALVHKTRYLRDASGVRSLDTSHLTGLSSVPYILISCTVIVIIAIVLYCKHLQRMQGMPSMRNVPSMSYFMTESDQAEQGLIQEKLYYP